MDVISKTTAELLAPHFPIDHSIDLEQGFKIPYGLIYNLSEFELRSLKPYTETHLPKSCIQRSSSSAAAPILIVKKKDGGLRLPVDYQALHSLAVKNRYPLPHISEMLDEMRRARILTKLDLRTAYHLIRIKERDDYPTAFRTWYGQFEYQVMPFGIPNAPDTFQAYISKMYFRLWKPSEVSERMWSVNLDGSISGEYQTIRGHSGHKSGSDGATSGNAWDKSGSTSNYSRVVTEQHLLPECCRCAWNAARAPGMLQGCLECCRGAWNATGAPGMLQVRLECYRCAWNSAGAPGNHSYFL